MKKAILLAAIISSAVVAEAILFYPMFTLVAVDSHTGKVLTDKTQCFPLVVTMMTRSEMHWIPNVDGKIIFCEPDPDGLSYGAYIIENNPQLN